jgi:cytochrome c553
MSGCNQSMKRDAAPGFVGYNSPTTPKRGRTFLRTPIVFGVLVVLAALAAPAITAQAIPDPSTDREFSAKLSVCNACHGVNGVRINATIPMIWGQPENYLVKQLHDFETGDRNDEVMSWMTKTLTQQELRVAAAYFAKQTWPARSAGAASTPPPPGIAVCQACHETDFRGAKQAEGGATPRLAGQSYEYLVEAMRRFAEGERKNNTTMMKMMAAIPPADREAMARYLSGL